jgi:hypothetical protein
MGDWRLRILALAALCFFAIVASAYAQKTHPPLAITTTDDPPPPLDSEPPSTPQASGGVSIGGNSSVPGLVSHRTCVDVQIGGEKTYGCLNQQLRQEVDKVNPGEPTAPLDAKSQDIQIGITNVSAIKQQYGENFGRSVFPSRPPPLIFTSPTSRLH